MKLPLPQLRERAVIVGKTGTGKTTLAQMILNKRRYVVVLDTKGLMTNEPDSWPGWEIVKNLASLMALPVEKFPHLIYQPAHDELYDAQFIDDFFQWIYLRRNTTLYVDEAGQVSFNQFIPRFYHAVLTRGREMNISLVSATQRPKQISAFILSEAERFYCFYLNMPQDRQRVFETVGITPDSQKKLGAIPTPGKPNEKGHAFIYADAFGVVSDPMILNIGDRSNAKSRST